MRPLRLEDGKDPAENPEEEEGQCSDEKSAEEALFKSLQTGRNDGEHVIHVPGKSERKRLPADHYIPPHHEDPEDDQNQGEDRPSNGEAGDQQKDEGNEIPQGVLEKEDVGEVFPVDDVSQDVQDLTAV